MFRRGVILVAMAGIAGLSRGQSLPGFEVASVRASDPNNRGETLYAYPGGRIRVVRYTLLYLIMEAFNVEEFQVSGGPRWINVDRYDLEAKPPESSKSSRLAPVSRHGPLNEEQRLMLQALLIERFQLRFHRESKEGPVYLLVRGRGKLGLRDAKDKTAYPWVGGNTGGGIIGDGLAGTNLTMAELAQRLSGNFGRPVLDRTGLSGAYDFKYVYPRDEQQVDILSSILHSLQALGLRLNASRGHVERIVIDSAEKPSPN